MINHSLGVLGKYRLIKRKMGKVTFDSEFSNLVTDAGLQAMAAESRVLDVCIVGSGSSEPQPTDLNLGNPVATSVFRIEPSTSSLFEVVENEQWKMQRVRTWKFTAGEAAGNLSEVGVQSNNGTLFSRSLIKDQNGDPTTITVLSDEELDVVYTVEMYFDIAPKVQTVELAGEQRTVTIVPIGLNEGSNRYWRLTASGTNVDSGTFNGFRGSQALRASALGQLSSFVTVPSTGDGATAAQTQTGLTENTYSATWGPSDANFPDGISSILPRTTSMNACYIAYQYHIDPPIMKTDVQRFNFSYKINWGRYTPPE